MLPGQQITVADFAAAADPIRSRLTKRERAIQIPIDTIHGLLNTLRAGDHVDILAAFNASATNGSGTPDAGAARARHADHGEHAATA